MWRERCVCGGGGLTRFKSKLKASTTLQYNQMLYHTFIIITIINYSPVFFHSFLVWLRKCRSSWSRGGFCRLLLPVVSYYSQSSLLDFSGVNDRIRTACLFPSARAETRNLAGGNYILLYEFPGFMFICPYDSTSLSSLPPLTSSSRVNLVFFLFFSSVHHLFTVIRSKRKWHTHPWSCPLTPITAPTQWSLMPWILFKLPQLPAHSTPTFN